jgi:pre-rRNA-processing protein IPI1
LQSKLIVLKSLSAFLAYALALPGHASANSTNNLSEIPLPTWYLISAFASQEAYEAFDELLQPFSQSSSPSSSYRCWHPEIEPDTGEENFSQRFDFATAALGNQWTLQELSEVVNQSGTSADGDASRSAHSAFIAVRSTCQPDDATSEWLTS